MRAAWPRSCSRSLYLAAVVWAAAVAVAAASRPQLWDPPSITEYPDHDSVARNPALVPRLIASGRLLFLAKFTRADGAGRPAATGDSKPTTRPRVNDLGLSRVSGPDSNSCAGCHNQPFVGGSGEFAVNVFVGAHFTDPPVLRTNVDVTSERNTTGLAGSGLIEMLAREMTADLLARRAAALDRARATNLNHTIPLVTKGISFGRLTARPDGTYDATALEGVSEDLVIKPFGAKGVVISLREFSINALNHHFGIQAVERFGWERTGRRDFDEDDVDVEFTVGQVSAMTLFQAALPPPGRTAGADPASQEVLRRGEARFRQSGCQTCHVPELPLEARAFTEPNPFNRPGNLVPADGHGEIRLPIDAGGPLDGVGAAASGTLVVRAFTDLKRHRICDEADPFLCNERVRQDRVPTDQFITAKLWDLATSAPYGHRGDCGTVSEIILHHSGEAADSRRRFVALSDGDKRALVRFLLSLGGATGGPSS